MTPSPRSAATAFATWLRGVVVGGRAEVDALVAEARRSVLTGESSAGARMLQEWLAASGLAARVATSADPPEDFASAEAALRAFVAETSLGVGQLVAIRARDFVRAGALVTLGLPPMGPHPARAIALSARAWAAARFLISHATGGERPLPESLLLCEHPGSSNAMPLHRLRYLLKKAPR